MTSDGGVSTGGPVGGTPVPVAELRTEPASISACVSVYSAVKVAFSPGASVTGPGVIGPRSPEPVKSASTGATSFSVKLPVLVTRNEYVTFCPTVNEDASVTSELFTMVRAGSCTAGISTSEGGESTGGPVGGVPEATAAFEIEPASTSACVTVYSAVKVARWPGIRPSTDAGVKADSSPEPENSVSEGATSFSVTFPVFSTRNE